MSAELHPVEQQRFSMSSSTPRSQPGACPQAVHHCPHRRAPERLRPAYALEAMQLGLRSCVTARPAAHAVGHARISAEGGRGAQEVREGVLHFKRLLEAAERSSAAAAAAPRTTRSGRAYSAAQGRSGAQACAPRPDAQSHVTAMCWVRIYCMRLTHVMQHASSKGLYAARAWQTGRSWGCILVNTEPSLPCRRRQRASQRGISPRSSRHWRGRTEQRRAVPGLPCRHAQLRRARRTEPESHGRKSSAKECRGPAGLGASKRERCGGGGRKRGGRWLREGGSRGFSRERRPRGVLRARARAAAAAGSRGERLAGPGSCSACAGARKPWRVAAALCRGTSMGSWRAALA